MAIEVTVPRSGESITEVQVAEWRKRAGDSVETDEILAVLETDKASVEVPSPATGRIASIAIGVGTTARVGDVLCTIEEGKAADGAAPEKAEPQPQPRTQTQESAPEKAAKPATRSATPAAPASDGPRVMPSARRLLAEKGIDAGSVTATGPGGRVLKEDVERHAREPDASPPATERAAPEAASRSAAGGTSEREEESVPMSLLRRRIAERLVSAQQTAALLTTFNEIDMSAVIALRKTYRDAFEAKYGIKLGFSSFFVKAAIDALKQYAAINAEIRGTQIVYKNYYDIGIAVGGGRGLVVPVIRDAERLGFAAIEKAIADFAERAKSGGLTLDELQGGTFTISNGGVYGSLLSTPIVNPPQSGILGLHKIEDRPIAKDGQVVVRPMMYVALTYDHRIVDGREAVGFLVRIKEAIEDPSRMLVEV